MTPADLKSARHALGLSQREMSRLLRYGSERTLERQEGGESDIPGPTQVLVGLLLVSKDARRHLGLPETLDAA